MKKPQPRAARTPPVPVVQPAAGPRLPWAQPVTAILAVTAICILIVLSFWPGVHGPFMSDDFPNIVQNPALGEGGSVWRVLSDHTASAFGRPVSMMSFALNAWLGGMDPYGFKLTNLAIHLFNTVLVFALTWLLVTRTQALRMADPTVAAVTAATVALLWALQPMQVSAVLYVVQRMTLLAATFSLAALVTYLTGRLKLDAGTGGWTQIGLAVVVLVPLSIFSKENGALTVGLMWCLEVFVLRSGAGAEKQGWGPRLRGALTMTGAAGLAVLIWIGWSGNEAARGIRSYSLLERVFTEGRVLWWYVGMTAWPRIGEMGLFHDDWPVSTGFWSPPDAAIAWAAWFAVALSAMLLRHRAALWGLAVTWFLVGHAMEAGPLNLELVYEHRNYLPSYGLIMLPVVGVARWSADASRPLRLGAAAIALLLTGVLAGLTGLHAQDWGDLSRWIDVQLKAHPASYRANMTKANFKAVELRAARDQLSKLRLGSEAAKYYDAAIRLRPDEAGPLTGLLRMHFDAGRAPSEPLLRRTEMVVAKPPMRMDTFNSVMGMLACAALRDCAIPEAVLVRVVNAALSNPATGGRRALLLADLGNYYGIQKKDSATASDYLEKATQVDGAPITTWLQLVRWQIEANRLDAAGQALERAASLDRGEHYVKERNALMRRLQAAAGAGSEDTGTSQHAP